MTITLKNTAAAFAAFAVLALTPGAANAQGNTELLELFAEEGFNMAEVHAFAGILGYQGQLMQLESGGLYGVYKTQDGRTFVVRPEFCDANVCRALLFASYYHTKDFSATYQQLNDFNVARPHGNASFVAEASTFVVQRAVTNISGITKGAVASEFGVFQGYSSAFDTHIRGLNGTANTIAYKDAGASDAAVSKVLNDGLGGAAPVENVFAPITAAQEILSDRIAKGDANELYYRQDTE